MIANLRFQETAGSVNFIPRVIEPIMGDVDGKLARIGSTFPRGFRAERDDSDRELLKLYKEDLNQAVSALNWICQDDVNFSLVKFVRDPTTGTTRIVNHDAKIAQVLIPGFFVPKLTPDQIHETVEDYKLLYDRFPVYGEIFQPRRDPMLEAMLEWLMDSQAKTFDVLMQTSDRKTRKQLEESKSALPAWIARVIELRKEYKKQKK